jgi:hypothetical protein
MRPTLRHDGGGPAPHPPAVVEVPPPAPRAPGVFLTADVAPSIRSGLSRAGLVCAGYEAGAVVEGLAARPADTFTVVWADPGLGLAGSLLAGSDPAGPIESWRRRMTELLALHRRNRRRLALIDARAFLADPAAPELPIVRARLDRPDLVLPFDGPTATGPEALADRLAALMVPRIDEIRDLLEELEASSISLPVQGLTPTDLRALAEGVSGIVGTATQAQVLGARVVEIAQQAEDACIAAEAAHAAALDEDRARHTASASAAAAQLEALRAELVQARTEAQRARTTALALEQDSLRQAAVAADAARQIELLRTQIALQLQESQRASSAFEQARTHHEAAAAQATREIELLRTQIALQLQEARRAGAGAAATLDQARKDLEATRAQAAREIEDLRTGSARQQAEAQRARITAEAALAQALQEAERLRARIAEVQAEAQRARTTAEIAQAEALREAGARHAASAAQAAQEIGLLRTQITLQLQEAQRARTAAEDRIARLEAERLTAVHEADKALARALADLRDEAKGRKAAEAQRDRLMRRVGDLNSKLDKVLASTSWRVTRPIRQVKLMFVKGEKPIDILIAEQREREVKH